MLNLHHILYTHCLQAFGHVGIEVFLKLLLQIDLFLEEVYQSLLELL